MRSMMGERGRVRRGSEVGKIDRRRTNDCDSVGRESGWLSDEGRRSLPFAIVLVGIAGRKTAKDLNVPADNTRDAIGRM